MRIYYAPYDFKGANHPRATRAETLDNQGFSSPKRGLHRIPRNQKIKLIKLVS
jgi:hypothetical protein